MVTIQVPADVERLISREMQRGGYASTEEVLRKALQALSYQNDDLAAIAEGIADMEAGRVVPLEEAETALREKLGFRKQA
ncbi:MAG: hypothetical protein KF708_06940 [Pirellulales bacterium]|nr:hypothetical protein [Pirellulales bacterium]